VVPSEVPVVVRGTAGAGQVTLFGTERDGVDIDFTAREPTGSSGGRQLTLRIAVGLGQITVRGSSSTGGTVP
jgi:hypothetical protein